MLCISCKTSTVNCGQYQCKDCKKKTNRKNYCRKKEPDSEVVRLRKELKRIRRSVAKIEIEIKKINS